MRQSSLLNKTRKNISKDIVALSDKCLTRADFVEKTISGVYRFLPLGFKVLKNIENIIRDEMNKLGSQEVLLPAFQNKKIWEETGRWEKYDPPLFMFKDIHGKEIALGPTHEEEITDIVRKRVFSYQDLSFSLFQIQTKFRNEIRATGGLLRTREFVMKDLYSFHSDRDDLIAFYEKVKKSYFNIFKRCGIDILAVSADSGSIGGDYSNEFMAVTDVGEDTIKVCSGCVFAANIEKVGDTSKCPKCGEKLIDKKAIELGHIFYLGDTYSKSMGAKYKDKDGKDKLILMGCYGIGVSRLVSAIVELNNDKNGIIWPREVSPFSVHLITVGSSKEVKDKSEKLYNTLLQDGISVLYDDRENKSAGEKFIESDLIGIFNRIVISEKTLKENSVGLKKRSEEKEVLVKINNLNNYLKK